MRVLRIVAVALAASALLAQVHSKAPAPPAKAVKKAPVRSDAEIESAIKAKFAKSKINADHFQVRVQGGIATIEGRTDVMQRKGVATRLAKTGGASSVINHIQISEAAKQKAAANLAKGRRRAQVTRGEPRSNAPVRR
jgi:osmotically-inducible protein OsmY